MGSGIVLFVVVAGQVAIAGILIGALVRSIQREKGATSPGEAWKNFGLSMAFAGLFIVSWILQGVIQWQAYVDRQRQHEEAAVVSDYLAEFSQSTLENWQSEFLQLFAFTVLAALLIHRGSAESRDSDDEMQQALARIEKRLETSGKKR